MRRIEVFPLFSAGIAGLVFLAFRTPFTLYMGLLYSLVLYALKDAIKPRGIQPDVRTALGFLLISVSPVFLMVKINGYCSPSAFHALLFLGLSIILFEGRGSLVSNFILVVEGTVAMVAKTEPFIRIVDSVSRSFVDVTSYLVRGLVGAFNVPITVRGNVATVRDVVVVIGSGCSGLDAFVLYLVATLLLILLRGSDTREALLLLAGALGIIPLNALRIFILLVVGYHSGISYLKLFHSHLGDLLFVVYVSLYWWAVLRVITKGKEGATSSGGQ